MLALLAIHEKFYEGNNEGKALCAGQLAAQGLSSERTHDT